MVRLNIRYIVGSAVNQFAHAVLSAQWFPLTRYVPVGRHWLYDIQRSNGSREAKVVLDVGANVGQTAWGLTRYFPNAEIHCFEPASGAFETLRQRYGARVTCLKKGLGSRPGSADLHLYEDSETNTLSGQHSRAPSVGTETVEITTVDAYCNDRGIDRIEILKLDVQGWEMEVLAGSRETISRGGVHFVFTEVGFHPRDPDMQMFAPLHEHLTRQGFEFCGLYDQFHWGPGRINVGFANALYRYVGVSAEG